MAQAGSSLITTGYHHEPPFDSGYLQVDSIHQIFYEQYGSRKGLPVAFLHGGPGGIGVSQSNTKFFDPAIYRVVLFDQRGAGKSLPMNELRENTSQHLVKDIEKLREHFAIPKWHMVFGGSWGSALSLLYAQTYRERVGCLVLRGVFTARTAELNHSRRLSTGAAKFFPDVYEQFIGFLPENEERQDPIKGYYNCLRSDDPEVVAAAARQWNTWGLSLSNLRPDYSKLEDTEWCLTHALLETHYFNHGAWLDDGQLLASENMEKINHIPGAIVQGRHDLITPPWTAWELHKAWPKSSLHWVDNAGHGAMEPSMTAKLIQVCDDMAKL